MYSWHNFTITLAYSYDAEGDVPYMNAQMLDSNHNPVTVSWFSEIIAIN
jgi:hypothetical protein